MLMKHHLTAAEVENLEGTRKTHFLNSQARRLNKSLGDATGLQNIGIHWVELAPGDASTELHRHYSEEEAVYVLEGAGQAQLDDEIVAIGPGDFIGLPAGGPAHAITNTSNSPLRLLVVGQRLPSDVGDYPRLQKRLYRHGGQWDLVDISAITDPKKSNPNVGTK